ncbi:MAG: hypothetical protein COA78_27840 [Blastopirellula sp.]|nr:MAG: hypothetical protein COA78_27840 [Blastopirellula sp.]
MNKHMRRILVLSLLITTAQTATLLAQSKQQKMGAPKDAKLFVGFFTGMEDDKLVMKTLGEKTLVKTSPQTRFIGRFRDGQIDKEGGTVKYNVYLVNPEHPDLTKVQKKKKVDTYLVKKLRTGWEQVHQNMKIRTTDITAFRAEDLTPYSDVLEVIGYPEEGNVIRAHTVLFNPALDSFKAFDKSLPNLLNIGDSISIGFRQALMELCRENLNYDHPRTNCGGISIDPNWFGAYDEPGRQWDVIAFNGGHWDSTVDKEDYMAEFEETLKLCLKAGRKVIWVTTANVPYGYNTDLKPEDPRKFLAVLPKDKWRSIQFAHPEKYSRVPGRMMLQNYWVKPILDKYPQVAVCDQWGYVYSASKDESSKFAEWYHGRNVHFGGDLNKPLAALVFELSMVMTGKKKIEDVPAQYRKFIHLNSKTYNPSADFDNPTPEAQRYGRSETPGDSAGGSEAGKWWTKAEYQLTATVVNYEKVKGRTEKERALERVKLAEKDLSQHEEWLESGEVPAEQVEKARRILEHAKQVHEAFSSGSSSVSVPSAEKTPSTKASTPTVAPATAPTADPVRTFTDTEGRQIEAEVVEVTGDKVVLRMKGKNFTLPMSMLSLGDQEYLRQWNSKVPVSLPSGTKTSPPSEPETSTSVRTFTDTAGKQVKAELVKVTGDKVTLRVNKRNLTFPLANFSSADQGYIKQWSAQGERANTPTPDPAKDSTPATEGPIELGKKYGDISDEEALASLPKKWHDAKHLPEGFPEDFEPSLTGIYDGGNGEIYDFNKAIDPALLKKINEMGKKAMLNKYYFVVFPRYAKGPGLSANEFMKDAKAGKLPDSFGHVTFLYGECKVNCLRAYWLYRITKDPYYIQELVTWADAFSYLVTDDPKYFVPIKKRDSELFNPKGLKPPHFFPALAAARLLLEDAAARKADASDPAVKKAKSLFDFSVKYMSHAIDGPPPETYGRPKNGKPAPAFVPGVNTKKIVNEYKVPMYSAFTMEYQPWNQSFATYGSLTMGAKAAELLYKFTGDEEYKTKHELYKRIVATAVEMFTINGDSVIADGVPYMWTTHTPPRDATHPLIKNQKSWRGHPLFGAEDVGHGSAMARNLPIIWEAGPEYCRTALVAGYANAMANNLLNPNSIHTSGKKKGQITFNGHIDSPWVTAKKRPHGYTGKKQGSFLVLMAFSPDYLKGRRKFSTKEEDFAENKHHTGAHLLEIEAGRYLYQLWKKRN